MTGVDWALVQDLSAPKKLLLVALAWIADEDGVTLKGQKTIADRLGKDPRWVREHLPTLATDGLVTRYRRHRFNGSRTSDLLVLNWPRSSPLDLDSYSGIIGDREPGDVEPSGENPPGGLAAGFRQPSGENPPGHTDKPEDQPEKKEEKRADPREQAPEGFPEVLRPHARIVMETLQRVAKQHNAGKVWPRAVGLAVMSHPRHPLVKAANALELWAVDPPRQIKDVVATYRTFLDRERELQATERLALDGVPLNGNGSPTGRRSAAESSTGSAKLREMAADIRAGAQPQ